MVSNLWLIGRKRDAIALYDRLLKLRNDVGLLSEEYDPIHKRLLGNFPQALSHISLIHAAFTLSGRWKPDRGDRAKDLAVLFRTHFDRCNPVYIHSL